MCGVETFYIKLYEMYVSYNFSKLFMADFQQSRRYLSRVSSSSIWVKKGRGRRKWDKVLAMVPSCLPSLSFPFHPTQTFPLFSPLLVWCFLLLFSLVLLTLPKTKGATNWLLLWGFCSGVCGTLAATLDSRRGRGNSDLNNHCALVIWETFLVCTISVLPCNEIFFRVSSFLL